MSKFNFIDNFTAGFARGMLFGTPFFGGCGFWGNPFYSQGLCVSSFMYPSVFGGYFSPLLPELSPPIMGFTPSFNFNFDTSGYMSNSLPFNSDSDKSVMDLSFDFNAFNTGTIGDSFTMSVFKTSKAKNSTPIKISGNCLDLSKYGYNSQKGTRLAQQAKSHATGWEEHCARFVKEDIQACGLGNYESGHAYQCVDILNRNKNFKRISSAGVDVKKLPAGCILVYGRGVAGYSPEYGHIEIALGNGKAASDGITNNMRQNPTAIFIPV